MNRTPQLRSLICLSLVALLHVAFFIGFKLHHPSTESAPLRYMQLLALTLPTPKPPIPVQPKSIPAPRLNRVPINVAPTTNSPAAPQQPITTTEPLPITEPVLDLDALRRSAIQNERTRSRSRQELQQAETAQDQSLEARLGNDAKKAARSDCRNAHSGAGLFAPLMIAADLIRDKGCKF